MEALADCDRALKLDARNAHAWNNRGLTRQETSDLNGALADFDRAIALAPRQADHYSNRGRAWLAQGKSAEAEADFGRCRALGGLLKPEAEAFLREMKGRRAPK